MSDRRQWMMYCDGVLGCEDRLSGPKPHPFDKDSQKMGVFECGSCGYSRVLYRSRRGDSGWQTRPVKDGRDSYGWVIKEDKNG